MNMVQQVKSAQERWTERDAKIVLTCSFRNPHIPNPKN